MALVFPQLLVGLKNFNGRGFNGSVIRNSPIRAFKRDYVALNYQQAVPTLTQTPEAASCPTQTDLCQQQRHTRTHTKHTMGQTKRPRKSSSYADPEIEDEELDCWEPETPAAKGKRGGTKAAAGGGARKQQRVVAESQEDAEADEQDEDSSTDEEEEESDDEDYEQQPRKKGPAAAAARSKKSKSSKKKPAAAKPVKPKKEPRIGSKKARKIYSLDYADLQQMKDFEHTYSPFFGTCIGREGRSITVTRCGGCA